MLRDVRFEHSCPGDLCLARNTVSAMDELEPGLSAVCVQNGLALRGAL